MAHLITISAVNELADDQFEWMFGNVIELCTDAAAKVKAERPFASVEELRYAFAKYLDGLTDNEKLVILQLHPDLAGRLAARGELTAESTAEQRSAGLDHLTAEQKTLMDYNNEKYAALEVVVLQLYPDLAGRLAARGELTAESTVEQRSAGLDHLTAEQKTLMDYNNDKYAALEVVVLQLYPDLAGRLAARGELTAESTVEQRNAGLDHLTAEQKTLMDYNNEKYAALEVVVLQLYPDLAGRLAARGELTAESTAEQRSAGLDHLTAEQKTLMDYNNEKYAALEVVVLQLYPDLAGRLAARGELTAESTAEQRSAGLDHLTAEQKTLMDYNNEKYAALEVVVLQLYPDLAGRLAARGELTAESTAEQRSAGLDNNEKYKAKFGFPFIICARENKIHSIIEGLQQRYNNNREQEILTGINEVKKICTLRILDIVKE